MSRQTTNYGYNISEGSDLVNPLVDIFPNWEAIDSDLKDVSDDAVGRATELTTGTVHALTRSDTDRDVFVFTATSNFTAGDTFTLDGTQVSALTPAGEQLASGCYIIGSDVLVAVHGTLMTMYVSPTKVADSDKLDGHDSTYFATASDVSDLSDDLDTISDKVGTGVLTTTAQDCVGAINELNSDLTDMFVYRSYSAQMPLIGSNASIEYTFTIDKPLDDNLRIISIIPWSNNEWNKISITRQFSPDSATSIRCNVLNLSSAGQPTCGIDVVLIKNSFF